MLTHGASDFVREGGEQMYVAESAALQSSRHAGASAGEAVAEFKGIGSGRIAHRAWQDRRTLASFGSCSH